MNEFATIPLSLLFKGGSQPRIVIRLTRVPSEGEYIHIRQPDIPDGTMVKVAAVTHLAWLDRSPDGYAEIHCIEVKQNSPGREAFHEFNVLDSK